MGNLPCFLSEVPDYAVVRGRMHITMGDFELVMPLDVFLDGCEQGKAAIIEWQRQQVGMDPKVIRMPMR